MILAYVPWLPAMLTRYQVDRSYWGGSLKLDEALRHAAISLTTGAPETMLEPDAARLLPWFGLTLALCLLAWVWQKARGGKAWGSLAALLVALLVPAVAILALASRTPKFNARYLMLLSPAYLLLLAGGMAALITAGRSRVRALGPALAGVLAAFVVITSLAGLRHWFTDPAFTKAQWRELAATVRSQIGPDETVLLVSGHAWPAWDYYAADIDRIALPGIDILDVDAVLGFETGATLQQALVGKAGAWLVQWQSEMVDPAGMVPYYLDRAGQELPVPGQFWQLRLQHWQLAPDASYPSAPQPEHADGANFRHQVALLGWDAPRHGALTLYWRALNPMSSDYKVSLSLLDAGGRKVWGTDLPLSGGYNYPTSRWQPGQALGARYPLSLPAAVPTGSYTITLTVYDDAAPSGLDVMDVADNPAGKWVRLGPVELP